MNNQLWRPVIPRDDCFLNPDNDVISSATLVIPEIMIKANHFDVFMLKQPDYFVGPKGPYPPFWSSTSVI
ncbi:hypothetical protein SSTU70S_05084 [Stutzerimonas stutzeri]